MRQVVDLQMEVFFGAVAVGLPGYRLNQALEISETIYEDTLAALLKRLDLSAYEQTDTLLLLHNPQPRPVREVDADGKFYPEMALRPMSVFCDASDGTHGVAVLNNCLTEFQLVDDDRRTLALTLLRATRNRICTESRVSSEFPEALGCQMLQTVEYEYAIYPHAGNWDEGRAYAEADKLNAKPAATQISMNRGGDLPTTASHYAIDNDSLILSSVKKAEDRDGLVLRLFNPTEETQEGTISFGLPVSKAWKANLIEKRGEELPLVGGALPLSVPKGKILTIEVE